MITQQRVAKNVTIMPADPILIQRDIRKKRLRVAPYCRVSKSVTRFARNTLEGLQTVRQLKGLGIGVYFEKENVNTLYMDNEMILTFFFSQAQVESESLSGNVKWGRRKNFQDGKVYYHYDSFLGYRKGEKIYVWRCLNRMEDRKRICKNSPAVKSNLAALEAHYKDFLNLVMQAAPSMRTSRTSSA